MTTELQTHRETAGMELQKPKSLAKNRKMTLEQYIDFFDSNKQSILTVDNLNQIVTMHAFKLIQRFGSKDEVVEAVKTIDLMEPAARSTLNNQVVSSRASITLEEAIKDLAILKWQECCITSLETINTTTTTTTTVTSISSSKSQSKRDSSSSSKKKISPTALKKRGVTKQLEPPESEARLGDVDDEISVELPAGCGKVSESVVTCKRRKRKGMSSVML